MQLIQFDFRQDKFFEKGTAFAIKAGYIIGDNVYTIGQSSFFISFDFLSKKLTLPQLVNITKKLEPIDDELLEIINEYQKMQKEIMQKKHPPTEIFVAFKRFENGVEKILRDRMNTIADMINDNGFSGIRELLDSNVFDSILTSQKKLNQSKVNNIDIFCNNDASSELKNLVWMLPNNFYDENYISKPVITDIEKIEVGKPYLIEICEIPNILLLSVAELKAIKNQLKESLSNIHSEIENWASACYNTVESASYFKEKVYPLLPIFKAEVENNQILKHTYNSIHYKLKLSKQKQVCYIYLGEVSFENIMALYEDGNELTEEEVSSIKEYYKHQQQATFPVMLFSFGEKLSYSNEESQNEFENEKNEEIETEIESEIAVPKKNFSID